MARSPLHPRCAIFPLIMAIFFISLLFLSVPAVVAGTAPKTPGLEKKKTFYDIPLPGQYAISAALGRDRLSYHIRSDSGGYTAGNTAQGLTARFTSNGISVYHGRQSWGLTLTGWGYGTSLTTAAPAKRCQKDNRIEYRRGPVTEWYVNGPFGLQQGFTLKTPPGKKNDKPLRIALALAGTLKAVSGTSGNEIILRDKKGTAVLRYGGLMAYDADGRSLPAQMESGATSLVLTVDDRAARYPVTIDPYIQTAKLTASDGATEDWFGNSVAIDGNTVVVGAYRADIGGNENQGAAYVFVKPGNNWADIIQMAKLTNSDGMRRDYFGVSVAIDGDTVVVGAYYALAHASDIYANGAAYVFVKPGAVWADMTETAKLISFDGVANDYFGVSVAIDGDTVVVGAYRADIGGNENQGAAYVFVKPGGGWTGMTETAKLTALDGAVYDYFGGSVSIDGDTVVVGAYGDDIDGNGDQGAAYVFEKPDGGWTGMAETAKLTASDGAAGDEFGYSVAIHGDTVAVGADRDDSNQGSAYVFVKPGGGWVPTSNETAKLTASDGSALDYFGVSVAIDGDTVVVGAYGDDSYQGAAYIFVRPSGGWVTTSNETAKFTASDGTAVDCFGVSVAIDGGTAVVGAYGDDSGRGAAYVFSLAFTLTVTIEGTGSGTVTSSPAGINCTGACSADFVAGTSVHLSATPDAGTAFIGWSGTDGFGTVTMDQDRSVTATFKIDDDGGGSGGDGSSGGDSGNCFISTIWR